MQIEKHRYEWDGKWYNYMWFCQEPSDNLIGLANQYDICLNFIFDKYAPYVTKQVMTRAGDPWITDNLKEMETERIKAEWRQRKRGLSLHLNLHKDSVEKFQNCMHEYKIYLFSE